MALWMLLLSLLKHAPLESPNGCTVGDYGRLVLLWSLPMNAWWVAIGDLQLKLTQKNLVCG